MDQIELAEKAIRVKQKLRVFLRVVRNEFLVATTPLSIGSKDQLMKLCRYRIMPGDC